MFRYFKQKPVVGLNLVHSCHVLLPALYKCVSVNLLFRVGNEDAPESSNERESSDKVSVVSMRCIQTNG